MLLEKYRNAVDELFKEVRDTQTENIIKAGELVAESIENGGAIFLTEICHHIEYDLLYRGGGPAFYKRFSYNYNFENNAYPRDNSDIGQDPSERDARYARFALENSNVRPGDVMFVSSVSGRTPRVVNLAYEAVNYGVNVIALTSMEYAQKVDPVHKSGKKLYEIATLTLDNCAPAAEAMIEVEGLEPRFAAASGIASDYIMWSVTSVAVETLMSHGKVPGIYKSANYPGGPDFNNNVVDPNYKKYGY